MQARAPAPLRGPAARAVIAALAAAPTLVPIAVAQCLLILGPWLQSLEADAQHRLVAREADLLVQDVIAGLISIGPTGTAALALLLVALWLVLLHGFGIVSWRAIGAVLARGRRGLGAFAPLACLAVAGILVLCIQAGAVKFGDVVDAATRSRPMAPQNVLLLLLSEGVPLLAVGAVFGAVAPTLAADAGGRQRGASLGVAAAIAALAFGGLALGTGRLADAADVGRSLPEVVGLAPREVQPGRLIVLVRDRAWTPRVLRERAGVPLTPHTADRVAAHLVRTGSLTALADPAERFVVEARLVHGDVPAAREEARAALARHGGGRSTYALLVSLGCAADARTRELTREVAAAPELRFGPSGLHLLAHAFGRHADRPRAEAVLARLRSREGDALLESWTNTLPLVLNDPAVGEIRGRVCVQGDPFRGTVGAVEAEHLFLLPQGHDAMLEPTWLLRLAAVSECDEDGGFALDELVGQEHALVLIFPPAMPQPHADAALVRAPLPRLEPGRAGAVIDVGTVDVGWD